MNKSINFEFMASILSILMFLSFSIKKKSNLKYPKQKLREKN